MEFWTDQKRAREDLSLTEKQHQNQNKVCNWKHNQVLEVIEKYIVNNMEPNETQQTRRQARNKATKTASKKRRKIAKDSKKLEQNK